MNKSFQEHLEWATKIVKTWPKWKQNILKTSSSPTIKRQDLMKDTSIDIKNWYKYGIDVDAAFLIVVYNSFFNEYYPIYTTVEGFNHTCKSIRNSSSQSEHIYKVYQLPTDLNSKFPDPEMVKQSKEEYDAGNSLPTHKLLEDMAYWQGYNNALKDYAWEFNGEKYVGGVNNAKLLNEALK